ncbi:trypsin-like peptidase domain-containing protein [Benzoatithermus flavus]|uniref:Trypsin-like peptidase domain-containing protein n=1 Tax=Benzoatithermus flavus TaxID=3108223 RepID=A0ABU8XY85_9PROT
MPTTTPRRSRPRDGGRLAKLLATALPAFLLAGCADPSTGEQPAGLGERFASLVGLAVPAEPDAVETASRSIWGVVPEAPRHKAELRPELIKGSAVAIASDTLLASCRVVGDRASVGLVRHNKYRIARVTAADAGRSICTLRVAQGPLIPAHGYRRLADLRPGEPVFALTSRTNADLALSRGILASTSAGSDPFLETTLVLPASAESAVLFDAEGNLIGLGSAGPTRDSLVLATPVSGRLAPQLASRASGPARSPLAAFWLRLRESDREPPSLFRTSPSDDGEAATTDTGAPATRAGLGGTTIPPEPAAGPVREQPTPAASVPASSPPDAQRSPTRHATRDRGDLDKEGRTAGAKDGKSRDEPGRGDDALGQNGPERGGRGRGDDRDQEDRGRRDDGGDDHGKGGGRD